MVEIGAGLGSYITDDEYADAGATMTCQGTPHLVGGRHGGEGKGASSGRAVPPLRGPDPLHLPPPGRLPRDRPGTMPGRDHRDRLRDGAVRPDGAASTARTHVRSGRAACQPRWAPDSSKGRAAAEASCWAGYPAWSPPRWWSSAPGRPAPTRFRSPWAWEPMSPCSTSIPARLREIDQIYRGAVTTLMANRADVRRAVLEADLVIGAVLLPGAKAPRVLTAEDIEDMKPGSVVVDIAIDQGGCFETSRETRHSDPTYVIDDVVHYAVGNMTGCGSPHLDLRPVQRDPPLPVPDSRHGSRRRHGAPSGTVRGCQHP